MLSSPSCSYLDLRAPGVQRIRRKPPPTVDVSERYPSPDPLDPFAPLWVLRNRTSSALLDRASPAFTYLGAYGSQETLEVPSERRRSMSYMNPSPLSQNASTTLTSARLISMSPSPSPSPKSKARPALTEKIGHYMRYSQIHAPSATKLQAFPCIASPNASQTDVNITVASPKRTAGLYDPLRSSTQRMQISPIIMAWRAMPRPRPLRFDSGQTPPLPNAPRSFVGVSISHTSRRPQE
ncbi:hypothetical protein BJ912DRAFT_661532 [Pholiota molesta]|nr:hypothetical protein BJ912DRAFT_661532 [Pholiota molesta]